MRKQYTPRTAILTIGIMSLSTTVLSGPATAEENISRGEIPRYCKMEAASSFSVSAQDVIALPAESDHEMFTVYGQTALKESMNPESGN